MGSKKSKCYYLFIFFKSAIMCCVWWFVKWTDILPRVFLWISASLGPLLFYHTFFFSVFGIKLSDKINHLMVFSFYCFCSCNINFLSMLIYRNCLLKFYQSAKSFKVVSQKCFNVLSWKAYFKNPLLNVLFLFYGK